MDLSKDGFLASAGSPENIFSTPRPDFTTDYTAAYLKVLTGNYRGLSALQRPSAKTSLMEPVKKPLSSFRISPERIRQIMRIMHMKDTGMSYGQLAIRNQFDPGLLVQVFTDSPSLEEELEYIALYADYWAT